MTNNLIDEIIEEIIEEIIHDEYADPKVQTASDIKDKFSLGIENDNKNNSHSDRVSIKDSQLHTRENVSADDFSDSGYEIIDITDQQKTQTTKAREKLSEIVETKGYTDAIDYRAKNVIGGIDKLSIKDEWSKSDHDANDKYLRQIKDALGIGNDQEKIKVITDIRKKGNDLFSR